VDVKNYCISPEKILFEELIVYLKNRSSESCTLIFPNEFGSLAWKKYLEAIDPLGDHSLPLPVFTIPELLQITSGKGLSYADKLICWIECLKQEGEIFFEETPSFQNYLQIAEQCEEAREELERENKIEKINLLKEVLTTERHQVFLKLLDLFSEKTRIHPKRYSEYKNDSEKKFTFSRNDLLLILPPKNIPQALQELFTDSNSCCAFSYSADITTYTPKLNWYGSQQDELEEIRTFLRTSSEKQPLFITPNPNFFLPYIEEPKNTRIKSTLELLLTWLKRPTHISLLDLISSGLFFESTKSFEQASQLYLSDLRASNKLSSQIATLNSWKYFETRPSSEWYEILQKDFFSELEPLEVIQNKLIKTEKYSEKNEILRENPLKVCFQFEADFTGIEILELILRYTPFERKKILTPAEYPFVHNPQKFEVWFGGLSAQYIPEKPDKNLFLHDRLRHDLGIPVVDTSSAGVELLLQTATVVSYGKVQGEFPSPVIFRRWGREESFLKTVKDFLGEKTKPKIMKRFSSKIKAPTSYVAPQSLSVSSLVDYIKSPWLFYFRHIEKLNSPNPPSYEMPPALCGQIIHEAFRRFPQLHSNSVIPNEQLTKGKIEETKIKEILFDITRQEIGEDLLPGVKLQLWQMTRRLSRFFDKYSNFLETTSDLKLETKIETSITTNEGYLVEIHGRIDQISEKTVHNQRFITVTDYKTSDTPLPIFENVPAQLFLYAALLKKNLVKKNYGSGINIEGRIVKLGSRDPEITSFDLNQVQESSLIDLLDNVTSGELPPIQKTDLTVLTNNGFQTILPLLAEWGGR